ncbi:terminase small subunit [Polaromonas naphthalenivorans]|uniref:Uncharacterized protein n=1 Tax=Polaromonas naphthalenivorans (strain CJ2) TaxID=365044 RepID=A1VPI8_POLNA|nr:terminase small subunit [Polaromonas naphthalenivorans]ABM37566.1 hypothetical protein Pnap_2258 [Polaromonas naphthalenivorans CJ2]
MRIKGQEQIAALFGVAPKTITEWQVLGFPIAFQGGPGVPSEYDSPACITWMVGREVSKIRSETPKDRLSRLQGDKIERDMMRDDGLLIPASEIEPMWEGAVIAAREYLLGEPPRIASLSIGMEKPALEELLRTTFEAYLVKLSNWRAAMQDDDEGKDGISQDDDGEEI